jgi:hypothetical protein
MRAPIVRSLVVSLLVLAPSLAKAGPPLLCFPMAIGDAASLPWGTGGWNSPDSRYDVGRLVEDTVARLGPSVPTLVRMETLRRAVLYASRDVTAADRLFAALRARVGSTSDAPGAALARFDLGYAAEAFRQSRHVSSPARPIAPSEDGYALITQALAARGADPAMEYAAALVTMDRTFRTTSDAHLRRAMAGAAAGSDLARTIAAHEPLWGARLTAHAR